MKFRQAIMTTALAVAAVTMSSHAFAETQQKENVFVQVAAELVQSAVKATVSEINQGVMKDVLTASHHFSPEIEQPVMVAKVEIKELNSEG